MTFDIALHCKGGGLVNQASQAHLAVRCHMFVKLLPVLQREGGQYIVQIINMIYSNWKDWKDVANLLMKKKPGKSSCTRGT